MDGRTDGHTTYHIEEEEYLALPPLNTLTPPGGIPNGHTTTTKKHHQQQQQQQQLLRSRDDEEYKGQLADIGEKKQKSESRPYHIHPMDMITESFLSIRMDLIPAGGGKTTTAATITITISPVVARENHTS